MPHGQCTKSVMFNGTHRYQELRHSLDSLVQATKRPARNVVCVTSLPNLGRSRIVESLQWLDYCLGGRRFWVRFYAMVIYFSFSLASRPIPVTHPASYPMGIGGSFPEVKAADREADRSFPSSTEVKNAWNHIPTPPYVFVACNLIN
jgi:hypothetical protein